MMDIFYENSMGERLNLLSPPYMLQTGEFFDYKWAYDIKEKKIGAFSKEIEDKPALLSILNYGKESYYDAINHFSEVTEQDVLQQKYGKLYIGDMYLQCYITASSKTDWENDIELLDNEITITTDYPFWIKEHAYSFKTKDVTQTNNKRYAYRYAYRYANGLMNTAVINEHYTDCNFKMVVYGPITDPLVYIGGHPYLVNIILTEGEYLEIDSAAETVVKVTAFGERVNAFHNRSFIHSVFEPVHPGRQLIGWSGRFDFDLTLYEERSEPKWGSRAAG
ncbi:hypothetical protein [Mediterraneibacter agrestimuris]|uniref:hypothetical protein n=1 Tax=Mediterraneibacter agrestimuris TaxID=2941333 RepID=UPI00203C9835|nr:hypothetical protein [Mediterraneibacter agrestimuris]